ncbi:5'-nucleotidase C-terminal domain-containing protein [Arenibacter troitsensis]|uniref:5'-nucleotidase, C-terminal domain n=1 Tax=Arenibacter troitsensis TaxID=188872 RepID=A0A1X7JJY7_9FLAO|nr:5'-nucleotidase [Arenibacter troitsensis]SMG28072.1 5'-nucleotidase, C-terminal domain [Arenibacter troitsensis]
MDLKNKHFVIIATILLAQSCRESVPKLRNIEGQRIQINYASIAKDSVENVIAPYRNRINEVLDSVLAYAPKAISKTDGTLNSPAGNLLADIVMQEVNPVFAARTGKQIDFVLLNFGSIRSVISQGDVTERTAYEVMPFENSIVIAELDGKAIRAMVSFLTKSSVAHPISGIQVIVDKNKSLQAVNIQGKPFDENRTYYVATSDYLVTGGDKMDFFKEYITLTDSDYLVRNILIDYFKKIDTLRAATDDRFLQIK